MPTGTANTNKAAPPEVIAARPAGHCVYLAAALIPSCCPCGVRYTPASMVSYNAMFVNVVMIIFHHWAINRTMPSGPRGESGHVGDCGTVGTPGFNGSTVPGAAGEGPPSHGALPVLLRPEARQCRHGGPRMVGLSAAFPVPRCRACGRCTRAWLPVAPGAHCTVWPCCVVTGPPVVGAPNAPRAPANEPANKPGGGARGAAGLRVRRRPGRCGLPRDPWAVVPKTPGAQRGAPANNRCGCCCGFPGRTSEHRSRAATRAPDWRRSDFAAALLRLPRREGARADAPTNKGRRKIRQPDVICVLLPVQSPPAVLLLVGPGIL